MKQFYAVTRDLHLYFGLFISPLVLVFAISVFFLVHAWLPGTIQTAASRSVGDLPVPPGVELLSHVPIPRSARRRGSRVARLLGGLPSPRLIEMIASGEGRHRQTAG